jgi:hypothetical protein
MRKTIPQKDLGERAEVILRFCQEKGYDEASTAFACVLAAATLGGEENKRELMSFMAHVFDVINLEN